MKLHRFALAGFAAGLIVASCSRDPKTANGTALYVNNLFDSTYRIRQLLFIGQNSSGNEVFQRDYRPATPSTTDLFSPQTLRILLPDNLAGTDVTLVVYALDVDGELAEYGNATAKVALGTETDVTVNMKPFVVTDGGTPLDGGGGVVDSGSFDASLPDGGVVSCGCNTTCCLPPDAGLPDGGSCGFAGTEAFMLPGGAPPLLVTAQLCGKPKTFCTGTDLCDPLRANTCMQTDAGPRCSCGTNGDPCPSGMRCIAKGSGVFACLCDVYSNCDGCCGAPPTGGGVTCIKPTVPKSCGAAGLSCQQCNATSLVCGHPTWGPGVCPTSSQCLGCGGTDQCCTGNSCTDAVFPTCRLPAQANSGSACDSCELGRASQCSPTTGQCACGQAEPCRGTNYCKQGDGGGYSCQPL